MEYLGKLNVNHKAILKEISNKWLSDHNIIKFKKSILKSITHVHVEKCNYKEPRNISSKYLCFLLFPRLVTCVLLIHLLFTITLSLPLSHQEGPNAFEVSILYPYFKDEATKAQESYVSLHLMVKK